MSVASNLGVTSTRLVAIFKFVAMIALRLPHTISMFPNSVSIEKYSPIVLLSAENNKMLKRLVCYPTSAARQYSSHCSEALQKLHFVHFFLGLFYF